MSKYRSEDEDVIVENPAAGEGEGETISAVPTAEPDMPPSTPIEPVNDVESTRAPEADPTVPEQRFRFRSEGEEVESAPVADPAEPVPAAPATPMDAPAAPADAPATPMDAPAAPGADAAPADAPAAPAVVPTDVPAAAPMAEPQPDAEVAPASAEGAVAPVAPEVAATPEVGAVEPAPAAPAEEAPVDNAAPQAHFKQEGEEISVVETPEPRAPETAETVECPESDETCVVNDVREPINPVVTSEDEITEDPGNEADAPVETETKNDITILTPEEAETEEEVLDEVSQCMRMEGEEVEAGDQDVNATVNVNVRKDDADEHAEDTAETGAEVSDDGDQASETEPTVPEQCGGSKKLFKSEGNQTETVADVVELPPTEDVVPVPDPNAGAPDASGDPDHMFGQWMQEGGEWM